MGPGGLGAALAVGGIIVMAQGDPGGGIALLCLGLFLLAVGSPRKQKRFPLPPPRSTALPADGRTAWCHSCAYRHSCHEPHYWEYPAQQRRLAEERARRPERPLPDLRDIYGPLMLQSPDPPGPVHVQGISQLG